MEVPVQKDGPLKGLRVLDLARFIAGPYCSMLLADMGAEVVKVEKPGEGEISRSYHPKLGDTSLYAMVFNRNKLSVAIDMRTQEGQQCIRDLAAKADIVVENFRPGVMEDMGCGWDVLSKLNPRLIMARISGFGQDGPFAQRPCFDAIAQAMSGLMNMCGEPDGPPTMAGTYICDYVSGMYACMGILAAVAERAKSGLGQVVDVALLDAAVSMLLTSVPEKALFDTEKPRLGNGDRFGAPNNSFKTASGDWVHICAGALFPRFAEAIGQPGLLKDPRYATMKARVDHRDAIEGIAAAWVAERTTEQVLAAMVAFDVPSAKVATMADVLENEQLRHRKQITTIDDGRGGQMPVQGVTIKLSRTPLSIRTPLPAVGADTAAVLADWLAA